MVIHWYIEKYLPIFGGRGDDWKKSLESNHFLAIGNRRYQDSSCFKNDCSIISWLGPRNHRRGGESRIKELFYFCFLTLGGESRIKELPLVISSLTKELTILYFSDFHHGNGHEGGWTCSGVSAKLLCPLAGRKQVSSSLVLTEIDQTPHRAGPRWWGQEYLKLSASAIFTQLDNHNCRLLPCYSTWRRRGERSRNILLCQKIVMTKLVFFGAGSYLKKCIDSTINTKNIKRIKKTYHQWFYANNFHS